MTAPQRALELAGWIKEIVSDMKEHFPHESTIDAYEELEAIARHYAEIMQAEAVGYRVGNGLVHGLMANRSENWPINEPLIIKPKPLP